MGCNSSYMNPTTREKQLQETAQLLLYVHRKIHGNTLTPTKLVSAASDIYCKSDYVAELYGVLSSLYQDSRDNIVYNAKDPMSRKLATWWEEHEAADRRRIQLEEERKDDLLYLDEILKSTSSVELTHLKKMWGQW